MCGYIISNSNLCRISNQICPYMFFCNKESRWKPMASMPVKCKIKESMEIPQGHYKVCFEKRGNLYVNVDGNIRIIPNPFDYVPQFVKVSRLKNGEWKVKK